MDLVLVSDLGLGYTLYKEKNGKTLYIETLKKDKKIVPIQDEPLYLTNGKAKTTKEAEQLVSRGEAKKYMISDLYRMAFPDEDEFYKVFHGMSKRMKLWIDKFYKNKGVVAKFAGWEKRDKHADKLMDGAEVIETFNNPFIHSPHPVEVYLLRDGRYAVEYSVVQSDTFDIKTIIFKRRPTKKDFFDVVDVEEVEAKIRYQGFPEEFNCWECGKHTHFTEICANNLQERISYWEDRYCGCC